MDQTARKRVTGASLNQYLGQSVTLLGEFIQLDPNGRVFTMKTSSDEPVTVQLQEPVQDLLEGIVEVQGTVCSNNAIQCQHLVNFPREFTEKIDMPLYNEVVMMTSRFPMYYNVMQ